MKKTELKQMIREELLRESVRVEELKDDIIEFIQREIKKRKLSDDEVAEFHEQLKKWINRGF